MEIGRASGLVIVLIVAAIARWALLPLSTIDIDIYLIPWLRHAEDVGSAYVKSAFTNYTPFYEHVLAALALFPGPPTLRIKLFSILFDVVLAAAVALNCPPKSRLLGFGITLLLPTVIINSALLGQADAIYVSFAMLALAASLHDRPILAMLMFSVSIAIKLQAIMFLPVLILLFLHRRQPLWTFLLIPAAYIVIALPMLLGGRPLEEIFLVYSGQFDELKTLSSNAPNPWLLVRNVMDYNLGILVGVPLAALLVGCTTLGLWWSGISRTREGLLVAAAILVILAPYVTPKMHERYFFLVDPVLVALFCTSRIYIKPLVLAQIASFIAYFPFLSWKYGTDNWLLGRHGYLQEHFSFGYGIFPAIGSLLMGLALLFLMWRAATLARLSEGPRESLPEMVRSRLRPVRPRRENFAG